jgi:hypothetical protein
MYIIVFRAGGRGSTPGRTNTHDQGLKITEEKMLPLLLHGWTPRLQWFGSPL